MSTRTRIMRTDKLKRKIVAAAEEIGYVAAGKKYSVDLSSIRRWKDRFEQEEPGWQPMPETVPAQLLPLLQSENGNGKRHATIDEAITLFKVKRDFYNEVLAMLETLK
jgi:transposase-like protein